MFCPKCGTNNEDNNAFCKSCGAKLESPAANASPVVSQGAVQNTAASAHKPMNMALIAVAAAVVVVVGVIAGAVVFAANNSSKPLFEQVKIGKTTAADVEKYFDKNNLGCERDVRNTNYREYAFDSMGHNFSLTLNYDEYLDICEDFNYNLTDYANTNTFCNNLSDTLWGADCEYFISVSGKEEDQDKKRDVLYTSCIVTLDGKDEEKEFRQNLNEYIKKHQKTELENQNVNDSEYAYVHQYLYGDSSINATIYPLEVKKWNGEKVLTCLCYNDVYLESDGIILMTLYAEKYYSDKELNQIMKEKLIRDNEEEVYTYINGVERTVHTGIYIDWLDHAAEWEVNCYYYFLLNSMYLDFEQSELEEIEKEAPDFVCSFSAKWVEGKGTKGLTIESYGQALTGDVIIPETIKEYPVVYIAENAFANCTGMTSIKIPDGITSIGERTFSGCNNLTKIELPDSIVDIGSYAFSDCNSLTDIDLPDSITYIGDRAFANCSSLSNVIVPSGVSGLVGIIREETFSGCSSLTSVTLPESITKIRSKAFANCVNLTSINIPSSVTEIADDAFDGCDNLVSNDLNARFPRAVPKPSWFRVYEEYINENWAGEMFKFIGKDKDGVPSLVSIGGTLVHYNGTEVERIYSTQNMEYNPYTNKVSTFSHISAGVGVGFHFHLIDLYTGTIELSCSYFENDEENVTTYYNDAGEECSEAEFNRISTEMDMRFGEYPTTMDIDYLYDNMYKSVDEAYFAYISNSNNASVSSSTPAADTAAPAANTVTPAAEPALPAEPASEYILPDSASRLLTKTDLQGLSADDCRIARNEIYARHGRKFDDEELQNHFNSCSWYHGTIEAKDFDETMLTEIEIANKNLIVEYETEMGYR